MSQTLWAAAVAQTPEIERQLPFKAAHTPSPLKTFGRLLLQTDSFGSFLIICFDTIEFGLAHQRAGEASTLWSVQL